MTVLLATLLAVVSLCLVATTIMIFLLYRAFGTQTHGWTHFKISGHDRIPDGTYPIEEVEKPLPPPLRDHGPQPAPKGAERPLGGHPAPTLGQDRGSATKPRRLRKLGF